MPRHVVLLRGINLGHRNRIAMAELRATLAADGFTDIATYVQSGNVVLSSRAAPETVAKRVSTLIKRRFGLGIGVVVRSRAELAEVVKRNPLAEVAVDPKHYLVTFTDTALQPDAIESIAAAAEPQERLAVKGREVYSWHPAGVGRSPLWERLAGKVPGITATTRNWATVNALLAVADHSTAR